ncbi:MAG: hypothetical protein R3B72_10350 [Polyangiaceae bacterium]
MALVVLLAVFGGLAVMLLLARFAGHPAVLRAESAGSGQASKPEIDAGRLRFIVTQLFEAMEMKITEAEPLGHAGGTRLVAMGHGSLRSLRHIVYLEASPPGFVVDATLLLTLAEDVAADRASVGVVVTPYDIDRTGVGGIEAELELVDGRALLKLIGKHLPSCYLEMRDYRAGP